MGQRIDCQKGFEGKDLFEKRQGLGSHKDEPEEIPGELPMSIQLFKT